MAVTHLVDTNVIIRLVTNDLPELAAQATAQLNQLDNNSVELPLYVLAESVYVLAYNASYKFSRELTATALQKVVEMSPFNLDRSIASAALTAFQNTKLDFVDCLLLAQTQITSRTLLTFDKPLLRQLTQKP
jgi:predicted nucleic-acid-binding protein